MSTLLDISLSIIISKALNQKWGRRDAQQMLSRCSADTQQILNKCSVIAEQLLNDDLKIEITVEILSFEFR